MTTIPAERTQETAEKLTRLRTWMDEERLSVVILRRTASVAWITAGGTDYVNTATSEGPITAVITADRAVAITNNIEAPRFRDEEYLDRTGWEIVEVPWYDAAAAPSPAAITGIEMTPETAGSDVPYPGTRNVGGEITRLRSRLLPVEQARFRDLAAECATVMSEAVARTEPGQSEFEIAGHLAAASRPRGIQGIVNLVATDDRIHRYRHPLPTEKKLERHALLVLCGRRDGLVASISRIVHFGPVPEEIRHVHEAVARIDAAVISASRPGRTLGEIFSDIRIAYEAAGFPGGWKGHHQGGVAAYEPREFLALPDSTDRLEAGMVCAWNPSLPGAKSEDSIIIGPDGPEVVTGIDGWPMVETATLPRPGILTR
ncbi:MAG: M24 family metallopeptidase [Alkalispirochaeta sp.]